MDSEGLAFPLLTDFRLGSHIRLLSDTPGVPSKIESEFATGKANLQPVCAGSRQHPPPSRRLPALQQLLNVWQNHSSLERALLLSEQRSLFWGTDIFSETEEKDV